MRQRTVSKDRATIEPPTSVKPELEVEDAAPARSSTPPPATGPPSLASSSSDHKPRMKTRVSLREGTERKEKKKRRNRDSSSSSSPRRKKSRSSTPRVSREEVSSLSTQFQELVSSLPDMLSRMIEVRLPQENLHPSRVSSTHSDLQATAEEPEHLRELLASLPTSDTDTGGHKRTLTSLCPVMTPMASPFPASPLLPTVLALPSASAGPSQARATFLAPATSVNQRLETETIHFLLISWTPIPQSWQPSFVEGKIRVSSPDPMHPSGFSMRTDVLLKFSTDEEGEMTILYKRKPFSVLQPTAQKVSTATLVDTAETLLRVPTINMVKQKPAPQRFSQKNSSASPRAFTPHNQAQRQPFPAARNGPAFKPHHPQTSTKSQQVTCKGKPRPQ
ncbi:hypothetical protein Pcinc_007461 [Petrolisthes cinctipes]|uniref:Uncharacterized protein n=1 Tax=Petrolisthes cinctipes TaxID=88211 RepID=A0AAE1G8H6_PETCI|nr:hypothetical protein Pcinc_007461 [Petrolisthes cinctipes]